MKRVTLFVGALLGGFAVWLYYQGTKNAMQTKLDAMQLREDILTREVEAYRAQDEAFEESELVAQRFATGRKIDGAIDEALRGGSDNDYPDR